MALAGSRWRILKLLNLVHHQARPVFRNLCLKDVSEKRYLLPQLCVVDSRKYSSNENPEQSTGTKPKKKKVFIPRVTLLTENDEMSIATLEMAEKIAKRRNLKLVKILDFDTKTERPTYKLMSTKDFIEEGSLRKKVKKLEKEAAIKPEKMMTVSSKINDHDLQTKLKQIAKFLLKRHEVRVVVTIDGNEEKTQMICTQIETALNDLPITLRKGKSPGKVKIHMIPIVEGKKPNDAGTEEKDTKSEQQ